MQAVVVVASGLFMIRRERRLGLKDQPRRKML
jgi:hypothetical protein